MRKKNSEIQEMWSGDIMFGGNTYGFEPRIDGKMESLRRRELQFTHPFVWGTGFAEPLVKCMDTESFVPVHQREKAGITQAQESIQSSKGNSAVVIPNGHATASIRRRRSDKMQRSLGPQVPLVHGKLASASSTDRPARTRRRRGQGVILVPGHAGVYISTEALCTSELEIVVYIHSVRTADREGPGRGDWRVLNWVEISWYLRFSRFSVVDDWCFYKFSQKSEATQTVHQVPADPPLSLFDGISPAVGVLPGVRGSVLRISDIVFERAIEKYDQKARQNVLPPGIWKMALY
ncbi:hypothetical protein FA13DRAFT_1715060 [Coprinellus micaceus]|uniref:Uncharacterized protein n=1 Tax=Coprinellus micaceus TaxID=71717 RepID=A0A4Y7SPL1_COPMI|nr:hypothetical protein FA13DRAFT_1715060 [Coprinellus micaceus]